MKSAFMTLFCGYQSVVRRRRSWEGIEEGGRMFRRRWSLLFVLYIIAGIIYAFATDKITRGFLLDLVEVVVVILLWPLSALGLVNLSLD